MSAPPKNMMIRIAALIYLAMFLVGCCPKQPETRPPWFGETRTIYEVVEQINANNQLIPTLYASVDIKDLVVTDAKGDEDSYSGDGELMYRRPGNLSFIGNHPVAGEMFRMGSNADNYWIAIPRAKQAWWGHHRNVGKKCVQALPIRPDLIVEVLGVSTTDTNLLAPSFPVMRFNHDAHAYVFVWHDRQPDRLIAAKEIWYDRESLAPIKVLLFDTNGRTILKATLGEHQTIEVPELPTERRPKIATLYQLEFPGSKAKLDLKLTDVALTYRNRRGIVFPNNNSFTTPLNKWPVEVEKVVQVDKACAD
jgi:hypothetical protein